jgi:DNA-binding transcriptional LysR family regulator
VSTSATRGTAPSVLLDGESPDEQPDLCAAVMAMGTGWPSRGSGELSEVDLRLIRSFVVLAEELHFGRASNRLAITQQALTQQIKRLEGSLGSTLFRRTTRRVEVTSTARDLLPLARDLLGTADRLRDAARAPHPLHRSGVRIAVTATAPGLLLRPIAAALREAVAATKGFSIGQVAETDVIGALRRGDVDAAFGRDPTDTPDLVTIFVHQEPRVAMLSTRHRLARAKQLTVADLADEPFLVLGVGAGEGIEASVPGRSDDASPRAGSFRVSDFDEMRQACVAGLGIGIAPACVRDLYAHPRVAYVDVTGLTPSRILLRTRAGESESALTVCRATYRVMQCATRS